MTNKQKEALKEVVILLRELRGDYGSTTLKGFTNKIDERGADIAITILVDAKLAPKHLLR